MNKIEFNEEVKKQFHGSWHKKIESIIESPEVFKIFQYLKQQSKKGVKITPGPIDLFKPFRTDLNNLKIVLVFKEPFLNFQDNKNNTLELDKLEEAWMEDVYKGQEEEIEKLGILRDPNLENLVSQGVMIINYNLNTSKGMTKEFTDLWKPFWELILDKIFISESGLTFIYFGNKNSMLLSNSTIHNELQCESLELSIKENRKLYHQGVFSKANELIQKNYKQKLQIEWLNILPF